MTKRCFDATQCFHCGTCYDGSDDEICTCDPIDASNYPNDSTIYFVARFRNFSRPNIHVIFEDSWEDTYDLDSGNTWVYSSYELNGWNGMITAELRDGTTVKETITTISGTGAIGRVYGIHTIGDILVGNTIKVYCDMRNVGVPASNNFKLQLINSDTGEEFSAITPNPVSCNPGGTNAVVFGVTLPSTPQTLNLRYNVILLLGDAERLDDFTTIALDVVKPGACVSGNVHTTTCDDGSEVVTERCIGGEWVGTGNACSGTAACTADVTQTCGDGSTVTTQRCTEGTLVATGDTCPDESGDNNKVDAWMIFGALAAVIIVAYLYLRRQS